MLMEKKKENRKYKAAIGVSIAATILLLLVLVVGLAQSSSITDSSARTAVVISHSTELLGWWSYVILGIWGLFFAGNISQKWLTQETWWKEQEAKLELQVGSSESEADPPEKSEEKKYYNGGDMPGVF